MRLIIGLGNPGSRYARTRHNFGYRALESLAHAWSLAFVPGKGDYIMAVRESEDLALVKPTAFMNESGLPVKEALAHFHVTLPDMLVIFDDIDLPLGSLRFRPRGGAGGHQGMASIIYHLGSEDFPRLRLGIATDAPLRPSEEYVLEPFRSRDEPQVAQVLEQAVDGIEYYLEQGIERTMTRFNTRPAGTEIETGKDNNR
ncbi:MAG: aminoacyl-tRNA hydrolase [Fidelibacterota bacterium]|nr:MAG: aminoacyl-tRNA hydrolase [Candidatus Neomarinimicrobiota bacterium]